jgi:hypothetical protein
LWQEPDGTAYFISTGGPGGNAAGDFHDTEVYELSLSTYLWLPFTFDGAAWHLSYSAQWSINLATGVVSTN